MSDKIIQVTKDDFFTKYTEQSKIVTTQEIMKMILANQKLQQLVEEEIKKIKSATWDSYDVYAMELLQSLLAKAKGEKA